MKHLWLTLLLSFPAFAQSLALRGYAPYRVTDIARRGLSADQVFRGLDRNFIKIHNSICSNRALMWAWDMEREYNISTAKIFIFYTDKTGEVGDKTWWHHVAPIVNQRGRFVVVDAGFPGMIDGPLSVGEWQHKFVGSSRCHEIRDSETELIERMFQRRTFPATTRYGTYDCYYRITPAAYWTPSSVAQNLLGRDQSGRPTRLVRDEIDRGELMTSCMEATTSRVGRLFTNERQRCEDYINRN